eukprot:SAG31_NODE_7598_length_1644_cov_1.318447_1_plen_82_part_10
MSYIYQSQHIDFSYNISGQDQLSDYHFGANLSNQSCTGSTRPSKPHRPSLPTTAVPIHNTFSVHLILHRSLHTGDPHGHSAA